MASAFDNHVAPSTCYQCGNPAEDTLRCSLRDNKNVCRDCFRDLPRLEDIGEPEWVCNTHDTRRVEFFCERCQIGCCKKCADDVHNDHKVVDVVKLTVEIRQKLQAQLEKANVSAEVLSELRNKVIDTVNKIKEPPMVVEKVVRELKEEVQRKLDEEISLIKAEALLSIMKKERQRDRKLKLAKERADRDIQRILAIQRDINTNPNMLGKVPELSNEIDKTESKLLEREQARESANLEIKSILDACPEKVIRRGRVFSSLVKTSSAFRDDQMDISASCKKVEADIPECQVNIKDFFKGRRPFLVCERLVLFSIIIYLTRIARAYMHCRDECKTMHSSDSMLQLIMFIWSSLSIVLFVACFAFYTFNYPIKIKTRKLKVHVCAALLRMVVEYWLLTHFHFFIASSPIYHCSCFYHSSVCVCYGSFVTHFFFLGRPAYK